ncbi:hypothetical protein QZM56_10415, partial [Burkholderia contaminans]
MSDKPQHIEGAFGRLFLFRPVQPQSLSVANRPGCDKLVSGVRCRPCCIETRCRRRKPTPAAKSLENMRIPRHPATQSALIWPGIPGPSGHLFHGHPAGQSERSDAGVA